MPWNLNPALIGKIAGALSFLAFVPYIVSTLRGINRPNRATWIIWTAVGISLLASYAAAGARDTLWVSGANLAAFIAVLAISFKYGEGGWTRFDIGCLVAAALGFGLWWWFDSPLPTLYSGLFIDFVGALPTIRKAWANPESEDLLAWTMFCIANAINLFAIREWSVVIASYPVYMVFITFLLMAILILRRAQRRLSAST
ncbi:MAG: hypothetical protein K8R69_09190 [Deltaproteobacteria bacterium]|nr:hypothetical protein [Deltaproteobacteria bacterium]